MCHLGNIPDTIYEKSVKPKRKNKQIMKNQYLIGVAQKDFIRMMDGHCFVGCTKTLEEIESIAKQFNHEKKNYKIYKLVEVKK